jgi:hypothetical protein
MNPVPRRFPSAAVVGRRGSWAWIALVTVAVSLGSSLSAGLVSIDRTLPLSFREGGELLIVGDVPTGTPLRLSFAFDGAQPSVGSTPDSRQFTFADPSTRAVLSIGEASWTMSSAVQLNLFAGRSAVIGDREIFGDIVSLSASTGPDTSDSFYLVMSATFVYPAGTLNMTNPVFEFPSVRPLAIDLASIVHESDAHSALLRAVDYGDGSPPISAVPEPHVYGILGLAVCAGSVFRAFGKRHWSEPSDLSAS